MSIGEVGLAQFCDFAREQIYPGPADVSLTSLAARWAHRQPSNQVSEST